MGEFNVMSFQSYLPHCRVLPPGEFNDMSFQSHKSLCRVGLLPLGEFTIMIPEPHATLQGVRIPSAILKIVFLIITILLLLLLLWVNYETLDCQWLGNNAVEFARWQHPAVGRGTSWAVFGTT